MRNGDGRNSGIMADTAGSFGTLPFFRTGSLKRQGRKDWYGRAEEDCRRILG